MISRPAVVQAQGPGCGVLRSAAPFRAPLDPLTILRLRRTFDLCAPAAVHARGVAALLARQLVLAGKTAVPLLHTRRLAFPINPAAAWLLRSRAVAMVAASYRAVARVFFWEWCAGLPPAYAFVSMAPAWRSWRLPPRRPRVAGRR